MEKLISFMRWFITQLFVHGQFSPRDREYITQFFEIENSTIPEFASYLLGSKPDRTFMAVDRAWIMSEMLEWWADIGEGDWYAIAASIVVGLDPESIHEPAK